MQVLAAALSDSLRGYLSESARIRAVVDRQIDSRTFVLTAGQQQITVTVEEGELQEGEEVLISPRAGVLLIEKIPAVKVPPNDSLVLGATPSTVGSSTPSPIHVAAGGDTLYLFDTSTAAESFLKRLGVGEEAIARLVSEFPANREIAVRVGPSVDGHAPVQVLSVDRLRAEIAFFIREETVSSFVKAVDVTTIQNLLAQFGKFDLDKLRSLDAFASMHHAPGAQRSDSAAHWLRIALTTGISPKSLPPSAPIPDHRFVTLVANSQSVFPEIPRLPDVELLLTSIESPSEKREFLQKIVDSLGLTMERRILDQQPTLSLKSFLQTFSQSLGTPSPELIEHTTEMAVILDFVSEAQGFLDRTLPLVVKGTGQPVPQSISHAGSLVRSALDALFTELLLPRAPAGPASGNLVSGNSLPSNQGEIRDLLQKMVVSIRGILSELQGQKGTGISSEIEETLTRLEGRSQELLNSLTEEKASNLVSKERDSALPKPLLQAIAQRAVDKIEALQVLARPVPLASGEEQQILALPIRIDQEWTEVRFLFTNKKCKGSKRPKSGRGYSAIIEVAPRSLGEIQTRLDYQPGKECRISMHFARNEVRVWFAENRLSLENALKALGLPLSSLDFSPKSDSGAPTGECPHSDIDAIVDIRV